MEIVKDNKPVTYRAVLLRGHCRELYLLAALIPNSTRTQQRWFAAVDKELFELAEVTLDPFGGIRAAPLEKAEEPIEIEFSKDAALGIKLALTMSLKGFQSGQAYIPPATTTRRTFVFNMADRFGKKFRQLIEVDGKLPENNEEEKEDLDLTETPEKPAEEKAAS